MLSPTTAAPAISTDAIKKIASLAGILLAAPFETARTQSALGASAPLRFDIFIPRFAELLAAQPLLRAVQQRLHGVGLLKRVLGAYLLNLIATCAADVVLQPLRVVQIHLEAAAGKGAAAASSELSVVQSILIGSGGARGLFAGVVPTLVLRCCFFLISLVGHVMFTQNFAGGGGDLTAMHTNSLPRFLVYRAAVCYLPTILTDAAEAATRVAISRGIGFFDAMASSTLEGRRLALLLKHLLQIVVCDIAQHVIVATLVKKFAPEDQQKVKK